jgi:DNA-binding NarL/FixJ family response regulator
MATYIPTITHQWNAIARRLRTRGVSEFTINAVHDAFLLGMAEGKDTARYVREHAKWECKPITDDDRNTVLRLTAAGLSQYKIAAEIGRSRATVQYILRQQLR